MGVGSHRYAPAAFAPGKDPAPIVQEAGWAPGPVWITYLLTPWSRVLLEKLTGSAASQEIPRIFGTRRIITVLTSDRHLSLS